MTVSANVKQTLANLKGVESTLKVYSLQSSNKEEKEIYKSALNTTNEVIKDLENRIKVLEFQEPQYKGN
ncbi:MAG: DUF1657 domain-containing protein [Clostridiales bacterium]|uniref:DUF1657 domain-containing protein n=1 Tax=Clostridium sp. N3C TaxID=1776758 RepID=UPI00092E1A03|nr:DUF1657 domain-containing protein [Clostridium sp. N3C]NLZ48788.1 DUF1657 domain-containing protein [Clostridiales bacterium]SCN22039.1 hypothetical protein N3C_0557 [Clostridium sp. N3C]